MRTWRRSRANNASNVPYTAENPNFQMELFTDTMTHDPDQLTRQYNAQHNINDNDNNDNNNDNDITIPKSLDINDNDNNNNDNNNNDNDITIPKSFFVNDNDNNNDNNNDNIELTGNDNDVDSLPENWWYSYNENNNNNNNSINSNSSSKSNSNLSQNNDNNTTANDIGSETDSFFSAHYENIRCNNFCNNCHSTCQSENNNNNNLSNASNDNNSLTSNIASETDSFFSAHYENIRCNNYCNNCHGTNNSTNNLSNISNDNNSLASDIASESDSFASAHYENVKCTSYCFVCHADDNEHNDLLDEVRSTSSDNSIPNFPPPAIPWKTVWVSSDSESSLPEGNVYESINNMNEDPHYLSATKTEFPPRHSTMDSSLPANNQPLLPHEHKPSCRFFCPVDLANRVPRLEYLATFVHNSVITLINSTDKLIFNSIHNLNYIAKKS